MAWKKVAEKDAVAPGKGREFVVDGKRIAIFNQDGFHALDSVCVHQDGSLAPGKLDGDVQHALQRFFVSALVELANLVLLVTDPVAQAPALHELRKDSRNPAQTADVVAAHDVGMKP